MAKFEIKDGVAIIPEGVTKIEKGAFKDCTSLEGITIPEGVVEIGDFLILFLYLLAVFINFHSFQFQIVSDVFYLFILQGQFILQFLDLLTFDFKLFL